MAEYPAYKFSLEKTDRHAVSLLNRIWASIDDTQKLQEMLVKVAEALIAYDICEMSVPELRLSIKPMSEVGTQQTLTFTQPEVRIGRTKDNHLPLKSPLVSKKHAEIVRRGHEFYLRDVGSNNGTFLNQMRLVLDQDVVLKNEDVIQIEPYEIHVNVASEVDKKPLNISLTSMAVVKQQPSSGYAGAKLLLEPSNQHVYLSIEKQAARWLVSRILTGQNELSTFRWSEIEAGVLEYLFCKLLLTLHPYFSTNKIILLDISGDDSSPAASFADAGYMLEMVFGAATESGPVYLRLYIPEAALPENAGRGSSASEIHQLLTMHPWLKSLPYSFSVHLGASMLTMEQIGLLEEGDIILMDQVTINLENGLPAGQVELRTPQLRNGVVAATLASSKSGEATLTVRGLHQEGLKAMSEGKKKLEEQQGEENAVLSNIELPVIIEFARLDFTLEEISSLREGQVIELEKEPPEVVDLSIEGKVIGSGKLVDVEGKLGVRIIRMLKPRQQ